MPLVLEAAFQAAGLHRMMLDGVMALPQAIGCLNLALYGMVKPYDSLCKEKEQIRHRCDGRERSCDGCTGI